MTSRACLTCFWHYDRVAGPDTCKGCTRNKKLSDCYRQHPAIEAYEEEKERAAANGSDQ